MTGAELAMTDSLTNNAWQVEAHLEYLDRPGGDTGQAISEAMKHGGWVHSAQFSPDGR